MFRCCSCFSTNVISNALATTTTTKACENKSPQIIKQKELQKTYLRR